MEFLKNLNRALDDAKITVTQVQDLTDALCVQNRELHEKVQAMTRRNMELQTALVRCRDMIESLRNASAPNELWDEASVYLSILEGLITERTIQAYPHYETIQDNIMHHWKKVRDGAE